MGSKWAGEMAYLTKCLLLLQNTRVQFLAPIFDGSWFPVILAPTNALFGLSGHLHSCAQTYSHVHISKNKSLRKQNKQHTPTKTN